MEIMTDLEITNILDIPTKTLADWKKKESKRNSLYDFLSKINPEEATSIDARKAPLKSKSKFSDKAKSVTLQKDWFHTDLLWSGVDGQRIGIDRLITIYMNNPDQRNTDSLLKLFGPKRVEAVVDKNFNITSDTQVVKSIALEQIHYGYKKVKALKRDKEIKINPLKLSKVLRNASQKRIDMIFSRIGEELMIEASKTFKPKYPASMIVQKQIEYTKSKLI